MTASLPLTSLKIGLVSVSDRASQGVYHDEGIPALQHWLETDTKPILGEGGGR